MGLFYDSTYLLVILAALISMAVSVRMNTIFSKYQTVRSYSGMTGREAAMRILHQAGIYDVTVRHVSGKLTDHYDPRTKTVNLSESVYGSTSVAAIGVAAHECGHAMQDASEYVPLRLRGSMVPVVNIGAQLSWPMILIGVLVGGMGSPIVSLGILLFSLSVLFQLVTLPVEFNASARALRALEGNGMMTQEELDGAKKVLTAAAMTYVAALFVSLMSLLRLVLIVLGRGRRDN